jgi:hypothetical protein
MMDMRFWQDKDVVVHLVAHIYGGAYDGPLPPETTKFKYGWVDTSAELPFTKGTPELIDKIENAEAPFFLSLDVTVG